MKKILLLFFTIFTLSSCEIQYDGETRIVVEGQLIDKDKNPISNKRISINTFAEATFGGADLISYANTDAEGKFTLIFPAPKSEDIAIITTINDYYYPDNNSGGDVTSIYQSKSIQALRKNFINYKLNLNQIILYKKDDIAQLQILLNKTNNNKEITALHVDGVMAESIVNLKEEDKNQYFNTYFEVLKNQNLKLSYTIADYSNPSKVVTTNYEVVIPVNNEKVIHAINY